MAFITNSSFCLNESHPNDWDYINEGGKHAVFAYKSNDSSRFCGMVLRVNKDSFQSAKCESFNEFSARTSTIEMSFRKYLDVPHKVHLDASFLEGLKRQAMESNRIPPSRRVDWGVQSQKCYSVVSELIPNYRGSAADTISIEIKPKAGYLATSPLVRMGNECKYSTSRFQILQQLNHRGVVSKGWNKGKNLMYTSRFDPIDLFSRDADRIYLAVNALFDCPQNNLKVFCGESMLYGMGCQYNTDKSMNDCRRAISIVKGCSQSSLLCSGESFKSLQSELTQIVSDVLFMDSFLQMLLEKQRYYDILDADGAILVYNRLVSLCGNSNEEAEMLLDAEYDPIKKQCSSQTFEDFVHYLNVRDRPSNETRESWYNAGTKLIEGLGKDECIILLQNWLLSLVLCDISFFIMLRKCNTSGGSAANSTSQLITTRCGVKLSYEIKVVDYDRKPAKKLRKRDQAEAKIALFHAKNDSSLPPTG